MGCKQFSIKRWLIYDDFIVSNKISWMRNICRCRSKENFLCWVTKLPIWHIKLYSHVFLVFTQSCFEYRSILARKDHKVSGDGLGKSRKWTHNKKIDLIFFLWGKDIEPLGTSFWHPFFNQKPLLCLMRISEIRFINVWSSYHYFIWDDGAEQSNFLLFFDKTWNAL